MKRKHKICLHTGLLALTFIITSLKIQAQVSPAKQWDKVYGGNLSDQLVTFVPTSDGGFVLGGWSASFRSGDKSSLPKGKEDYWIVKIDSAGNKEWDKSYGGNDSDIMSCLRQTSDGGFILGGSTSTSGISGDKSQLSRGGSDYWIIKVDANGEKIWDKTFGGDDDEALEGIQQTADGGYIIGGISASGKTGDKSQELKGLSDYWIVKLDANGNKTWDKAYGGSYAQRLTAIQQTKEGGYILGGWSASSASGDKSQNAKGLNDYWIIKITENGNKVWDRTFGCEGNDMLYSLKITQDGGYMIGGRSYSSCIHGDKSESSQGFEDFWIIKLDANGNKSWDKTLGGNGGDVLKTIYPTSDGGYLLGGTSTSGISGHKSQENNGMNDFWIIRLDKNGNPLWDKTFGGNNQDLFSSLIQTDDNGYIIGGYSDSDISGDKSQASKGNYDFWLIKLAPDPHQTNYPLKFYNIITPNNDKRNDCFFVENLQYYPNSTLNVYNRWGQRVYRNNYYDNSFDGKDLSDGTYFYILTTLHGEQYKGWVELVR